MQYILMIIYYPAQVRATLTEPAAIANTMPRRNVRRRSLRFASCIGSSI